MVYGVLRVNLSGIDNMFRNYCWQTIVNINLVDFSIKASCVGGRRRLPPHDSVNCDVKQNAAQKRITRNLARCRSRRARF